MIAEKRIEMADMLGILGDCIPHDQLAAAFGISLKTLENLNRAVDDPPRVKLGRHGPTADSDLMILRRKRHSDFASGCKARVL
jgi:hypothetical protein